MSEAHLVALATAASTAKHAAAEPAAALTTASLPEEPPLVLMLSMAHPPEDIRIVRKEGASLAKAGWRVRHLCPDLASSNRRADTARAALEGVAIETFARRPGWRGRLAALPGLIRAAAASRARVIHAHEPDSWLAAIIAGWWSGARVVIDVHEHYPSRLDTRLPRALRPVSRAVMRGFCRLAGLAADAVVVARQDLARDFFRPSRAVSARNHALPSDTAPRAHAAGPLTLVHVGVLGRTRGVFQMLDTLALCPPGTRLRLIGRITDGSGAEFHARAEAMGLADRIEDGGWVAQEALPAEVARADIGLVLFQPVDINHRLALPHKLFDCMLAGLPVIAPDFAPETAAVVHEADCGLLVDTADSAAIAAAVAQLADPALRARLGANGRRAALARFGWPEEAKHLLALYQRLAPLPVAPKGERA
ncbi:glycosyltransferase [Acetobacteraceae bacterium H6797]|nr:glycosyltransferase [Acetobacteraceae bacterium H6797]